jgi:3-dehydroquinate dehydratase II
MTAARNRVMILHGVNLDMLGRRDPGHYGTFTMTELEVTIKRWADELGLEATFFHSNHEGEYIETIHRLAETADGAILNPGSWAHYSYAIHDALELTGVPAVEVHISDVHAREEWRRVSVLEDVVIGQISGRGSDGYRDALAMLKKELA